jgi:hypothetical protein
VASGAVALLLEQQPKLSPHAAKLVLQATSSFLPEAGLVGGGAGSLNAAAAVQFAGSGSSQTLTTISRQTSKPSDLKVARAIALDHSTAKSAILQSFFAKHYLGLLFWDGAAVSPSTDEDTIYWGTNLPDTIYWGTAFASALDKTTAEDYDTIYWGTAEDTIYWGTTSDDTIYWGTMLNGQ